MKKVQSVIAGIVHTCAVVLLAGYCIGTLAYVGSYAFCSMAGTPLPTYVASVYDKLALGFIAMYVVEFKLRQFHIWTIKLEKRNIGK